MSLQGYEWESNETSYTINGLLIGSHTSYDHYPHVESRDVYSGPTSRVYGFKVATMSLQGYEWETNEPSCTLNELLTGSHKSYGNYPHVESRDVYSGPASRVYGFKVATTLLQGYEWESNETSCTLNELVTGSHKSYGHYPHVESRDVYSGPASRVYGFRVRTTWLQAYEWELNETSCILNVLLTGSHKSYGHYLHVESRDVYSGPASRVYGFKVATTSLQGYEWESNETSCTLNGLVTGSHKSYGHYPHVEWRDVYSGPASRVYGFRVRTTWLQAYE
jgi:hypothetical protein